MSVPAGAVAKRAVVIVGSSGAHDALGELLPALKLPADTTAIVLVHLPETGDACWPASLRRMTTQPVEEARDCAPASGGVLYAAPAGYHLLVECDGRFALSLEPRVRYVRPAADVLLPAAADCWGPALLAVVLSGANDDGAHGVTRVRERGGTIIVQSPEDADFPTMPRAALERIDADRVSDRWQLALEISAWMQ